MAVSSNSLVDPVWESIDPNPNVHSLFIEFDKKFFWGSLSGCEVRWSPRMTLCAGLCHYEGRGGLCSIRLSEPLLKFRPRKDLVETLLHEMIHAYLFVTQNNRDHNAHGPEFHKHMYRINAETGTHITVYHNFHDEVDHHRVHWWKCDGPCQHRAPYFGIVKRATNRAPGPNDFWWTEHQLKCGGNYTKIREPEGYGEKKSKKKVSKESAEPKETMKEKENQRKLTDFFDANSPGNGAAVGSSSSASDREVNVMCPSCTISISVSEINAHLDACLD